MNLLIGSVDINSFITSRHRRNTPCEEEIRNMFPPSESTKDHANFKSRIRRFSSLLLLSLIDALLLAKIIGQVTDETHFTRHDFWGHAVNQTASRRPLTAKDQLQYQNSPRGTSGVQKQNLGSPPSISVLPCQYHSSTAPHAFIRLSPKGK